MGKDFKVAVHIPDAHVPWNSIAAFKIVVSIIQYISKTYGLDELTLMGDFLDWFHVKFHDKMPSQFHIKETFRDEVYLGNQALDILRDAAPEADFRYIEGNHEYRLLRYLVKNCPELFDIVTMESLLKLKSRHITYCPLGKKQLVPCLGSKDYHLRHIPYNQGKHTAMGTLDNKKISLGYGHTHRKQLVTVCDALGKELVGRSLGWIGDRFAPPFEFMDCDDWSMGLEVVMSHNNLLHKTYIDILHDKKTGIVSALYDGIFFEADYESPYDGYIV